ncbi:MAG: MFS transporter [Anaerolineales bacterium]
MTSLLRYWLSLSRDLRWITVAIFLSGVAEGLSLNFHTLYVQRLGATPEQIGLTFGAAGLVTIFIYVPAGLLADRWRRKPIILAAWFSTILTFIWLSLAPDWRWAIPGFMLYALGSFSRPAFSAYLAGTEDARHVTRAFAVTSVSWSLGSIAAPAIGGWIGEQFGLPTVFAASGVVYTLSTLALFPISNPPPAAARPQDVHLGRLFQQRPFLWQVFILMLIMFALNVSVVLAPNYLREVKGLTVQQVGTLGTVASLGLVALTIGVGRFAPEKRAPLFAIQATLLIAVLLLWLSPASVGGALPGLIVVAYLFRGGADAIWTPMSSRLSLWLPAEILSLGFSFRDTAVRTALTLAPLVAGWLYAIDPALPLYVGLIATTLTMTLTFTLPNYRPQTTATTPAPVN